MVRASQLLILGILTIVALPFPAAAEDLAARLADTPPGETVQLPAGNWNVPLKIERAVTLRGQGPEETVLQVTSNGPALSIQQAGPVLLEGLTIQWQLSTSTERSAGSAAVFLLDSQVTLKNCRIEALGGPQRCPAGVSVAGFSKVNLEDCHVKGFEFSVGYSGGAQGTIQNSVVQDSGHCGITSHSGAEISVIGCLVTGSDFHGVRCTGGNLNVRDSLIIDNANRGVYLGNRRAQGEIVNNVIQGNGTGISAFGGSDVTIQQNVIRNSGFAAIDARDSCPLRIEKNVLLESPRGVAVFEETGNSVVQILENTIWKTDTPLQDATAAAEPLAANPELADPDAGDFAVTAEEVRQAGHGLQDPAALQPVWQRWQKLQARNDQ